jgi:hypothetical protein
MLNPVTSGFTTEDLNYFNNTTYPLMNNANGRMRPELSGVTATAV